jgi:hypothetical protein
VLIQKTGPHIQHATDPARQWARVAPIVKCVDYPELLDEVPPGAITIFRASEMNEPEKDTITPSDFLARIISRLAGRRPDYIESQNEWRSHILGGFLKRLPWETEFVGLAHAAGYKACGINWPWGSYDQAEVQALKAANYCGLDAIGLHEYGPHPFDGWSVLRYRKFHEWAGRDHPPILITEAGLVDATDVAWIPAYDAEIAKDNYIFGAVIFGAGPWPDWITKGYDYDSRISQILPMYIKNPSYTKPSWAYGGAMPLKDQYPQIYAEWDAAGGVENNFRAHLLGIGAMQSSVPDVDVIAGNAKASIEQLANVAKALSPKA